MELKTARKIISRSIIVLLFVFVMNLSAQGEKADYAGTEACATCHEEIAKNFEATLHGRMFLKGEEKEHSCESCHGQGSIHVEKMGGKNTIEKENWKACATCHSKEKMKFTLQYHHPVPEGRLTCSTCHSVHNPTARRPSIKEENDKCISCHQQYKGPYVFEHLAIEEDGCKVCHNPHGSINPKMLTENDFNLCLKCHYSAIQYQRIGHYAHRRAVNPAQFGAKCTGCHRGVHGSNFSKELRTD